MQTRLLMLAIAAVACAETADFILLADPGAYRILNKFEQELTKDERRFFTPGVPLQIVNEDRLLGDQITRAMKVRFRREDYFLQKNDDGSFTAQRVDVAVKRVKRCEVIDDTAVVARQEGLTIRADEGGVRATVGKGDRLHRVFRSGDSYYVALEALRPAFGWCSMTPQDVALQRVAAPAVRPDTVLSDALRSRIIDRLNFVNRSYQEVFGYLNRALGQSKAVPAWQWSISASGMECTLHGLHNAAELLSRSTAILVRDIEGILTGRGFAVSSRSGVLRITLANR